MNVVIIGPQGSGKGTQAAKLSNVFGIPHISVGDILREEIKAGTELGKKAKIIEKGMLLPDELVDDIVRERIHKPDCKDGFILDGYPRRVGQAEVLEGVIKIDSVLELQLSDEVAIERLSKRRVCTACESIYAVDQETMQKECMACGGTLVQREDDKPEGIKKRLQLYHQEIDKVLAFYRPKNILYRVDASGSVEEVFEKLCDFLRK